MKDIRLKASYTIEASVWIPFLFFMIAFAVKTGVSLHNNVKEVAYKYENMQKIDAINRVHQIKFIENLVED